ncbi:hypothetical protein [Pelagibius marinus]|uniref:hypothetical protein n=1 Tax=Pelagibius marinus TaxID=2762760 RepID=UPI00187307C5|nr:hypothetical protein [Pelagibius marinus]
MERKTAIKLLATIEAMAPQFDEITSLTYEIVDETERKEFREKVAEAMSLLAYDLVMQIVRQYPDLDPDKERYSRSSSSNEP